MADRDTIAASIKGHKGHFKRNETAVNQAITDARDNRNQYSLDTLRRAMQTLSERHDTIEGLYDRLATADPDTIDECNKNLDALQARLLTVRSQAMAIFGDDGQQQQTRRARNRSNSPIARFREANAMRPEKLEQDANPVTLRAFLRQFEAYYRLSSMDQVDIRDQQAMLFRCMDINLETSIRDVITDQTPIFGNDSCIQALEEKFNTTYPLYARRFDYFNTSHPKGTKLSEAYRKLVLRGNEADMANIKIEEIHAFLLIRMCSDDTLKRDLLKLEQPTLEEVLRTISAHEKADRATQDRQPGQKTAAANVVRIEDLHGKCYGCGGRIHKDKSECKARNTVCKCGAKGHFTSLCFTGGVPKNKNKTARARQAEVAEKTDTANNTTYAEAAAANEKVQAIATKNSPTPKMTLTFSDEHGDGQFSLTAIPDTGATKTLINTKCVQNLNLSNMVWRNKRYNITAANGTKLSCEGTLEIIARNKISATPIHIETLVTDGIREEMLLGWQDLRSLSVIPPAFPEAHAFLAQASNNTSVKSDSKSNESEKNNNNDSVQCGKNSEYTNLKVKCFETYEDVFGNSLEGACGKIKGPPMKIHLKDNVTIRPSKIMTARPVPIHMEEAARDTLNELIQAGAMIPEPEPTDWVSPAHFVPKSDGRARLVCNYIKLNEYVKRPIHPFLSAKDLMQKIEPQAKVFAKFDAVHGYFQIPLDEESSKLTTVLLPSGRFRWACAPMGLSASSDEFCRRTDEAFAGLPWLLKIVDDGLIQAKNTKQLMERVNIVLERCRQFGIRISKKKFDIGSSVRFAGFVVSDKGIKPDPEKVEGISSFPQPQNPTEVRSFLGLVNQLGSFLPDLAHNTVHIRSLLKKNVIFRWDPEMEHEFKTIKEMIIKEMTLYPFDTTLPTQLLTDASRLNGLGFALIQYDQDSKVRLIACNSTSLTPAQKNYATVELEAMAILWAVRKCSYFLKGINSCEVITDHKPLEGNFSKPLGEIDNPRLMRIREKLIGYPLKIKWTEGKTHIIADALSRSPIFRHNNEMEDIDTVCLRINTEDPALEHIKEAGEADETHKLLCKAISHNMNPKNWDTLAAYTGVWHGLSIQEGLLILDGNRIVIPKPARKAIVELLHTAHTGITKTIANAQRLYFWPGMRNDIKQKIAECTACHKLLPSQPREPLQTTKAEFPMQMVDTDLFEHQDKDFLVMVDRYSGFQFAERITGYKDTNKVTKILSKWFQTFGFPERLRSDGGPQFKDYFSDFCKMHNIQHDGSSAYNSQSNGLAESAVKNVKHLLIKCLDKNEDFDNAMREMRNCPRANGFSPAEIMFNRRPRGSLPAVSNQFRRIDYEAFETTKDNEMTTQQSTGHLSTLQPGDRVTAQNPTTGHWDRLATVTGIRDTGRSYNVKMDDKERILTRNRRLLRPAHDLTNRHIPDPDDPIPYDSKPRRSSRLATLTKKTQN